MYTQGKLSQYLLSVNNDEVHYLSTVSRILFIDSNIEQEYLIQQQVP